MTNPNVKRDRQAYQLAWEFMLQLGVPGLTEAVLSMYLFPDADEQRHESLEHIYRNLLFSAQNANMRAGVVGRAIGGFDNLGPVLFGFDPVETLRNFSSSNDVLNQVVAQIAPRGKVRRTPQSIWPRYCETILSAAEFITQFESAEEFHAWAQFFDNDARARPALPMLLASEIDGLGFALACDFLKELGYHNYAKPDIHIMDIFESLSLSRSRKEYDVFKAVVRVAEAADKSPYCVDKLFWLIGSGAFYHHPTLGGTGDIGNHKPQFYAYALPRLAALG